MYLSADQISLCPNHSDPVLKDKWAYLKKNMDTLVAPTLVFWVDISRGESPALIIRVMGAGSGGGEKQGEDLLIESSGCSCHS